MKISIVIPTLNEEYGIGPTLDAVDRDAFDALGWQLEFLVIDGDSKDRTREEAEARGARVIVDKRKGYGRAYKTGFAEADGDIIVTGDADGTYPFDEAHIYVQQLLRENWDFMTCNRYADLRPGAMSGKHRLGNWILSTTARVLYFTGLKDSQSGMWIIRRHALDHVPYDSMSEGMPFSQEIKLAFFKHKDLKSTEVNGRLNARIGEPVIMSWQDGFGNLLALGKQRFRRGWMRN